MKTKWGEALDPGAVLQEYPRPQLVRESYRNLNGWWDYAITDSSVPPDDWDGKILVPFSPEAELSGVGRTLLPGQTLWYHRALPEQPQPGMNNFYFKTMSNFLGDFIAGCDTNGILTIP